MVSLKDSARHAFQEEPPFPDSTFEKFEKDVLKGLEQYMNINKPRAIASTEYSGGYQDGWACGKAQALRFLRGEQ